MQEYTHRLVLKNILNILHAELRTVLDTDVKLKSRLPLVPNIPISEIVQQVKDRMSAGQNPCLLGFEDPHSDEFVCVIEVSHESQPRRDIGSPHLNCFSYLDLPKEAGSFGSNLLHLLSCNKPYIQVEDMFHALHPSSGTYVKCRDRQSILICTPCFKRPEILRVYCKYMLKYFIPQLIWDGYDACLALCGGPEEKAAVKQYLGEDGLVFLSHKNDLGQKKNTLFAFARDADFEFATTIDSDDFVHPATTTHLIDIAKRNGHWSSIEPFYFHDLPTGAEGLFEGYAGSHQLHGWGMGSARVFTAQSLDSLGESPFDSGNKGMDDSVKKHLALWNIESDKRLLSTEDCRDLLVPIPIGVKSDVNVWRFRDYRVRRPSDGEFVTRWLPPEISNALKALAKEDT